MMWIVAIRTFLKSVPWQVWVVAGLLAVFWYIDHRAYNRGYDANEAKWEQAVVEERARQEAANAEALAAAQAQVARLNSQRAAMAAEVERLIEDANSDPDADRRAISVDSVRRLEALSGGTDTGNAPR